MKKALSLFLALIIAFGVVAVGIIEIPHVHAEEAVSQQLTENSFVYEVVDEKAIIVDYTDKQSTDEIFIPDTLGGHPVTELAAEAFKGCQCTAVTIPASVTDIDVEAFAYDMPNLERYTVDADNPQYSSENGIIYSARSSGSYKTLFAYPKNAPAESLDLMVVEIAPFAFTGVSNLKSISLTSYTNRMTYDIKKYAFYKATSLESVAMEDYINSIGDYAFASCPSLESVSLSDVVENLGWEIFDDTPFINNAKNYDDNGVLYLDKNLIATHPFGDIKEYYEINAGTEAIAGGAFEWNSLKKVYFPSSVEHIESNPFAKCPNLETFTFHSEGILKVDKYGVLFNNDSLIAYPNGIYRSCYFVEPIVNRHSIIPYAFYLSPIKNIYIPSSELSYKHLGYCSLGDVTDVHFKGDETAWNNMRYVKERYEPTITAEDNATIHFNSLGTSGHEIISDNGIQSVCLCGYTAKHDSANGNSTADGFVYEIVNKKMVIKGYKFKDSTSALVIPETIEGYPVTRLERGAFNGCMFTSVQIPASVTEIDPEAFAYALNNQSFTVAAGNRNFKAIDGVLFKNGSVTALFAYPQNAPATEYQQPAEPVEILPYAFYGSKNLKTLNSWKSVTVQDYAFLNSSIESFINSDFKRIGNGAFKNSKLNEVSVSSTPKFLGYNAFEGTPFLENAVYDNDGAFYHGNILVATKEESDKNYYEIKDGTTVIAGGAFLWKSLEEVYIPESVETVNGSAFTHATNLKTFTLDSNNKHFGICDGIALYDIDRTKLIALPPAVEMCCYGIPDGVYEIGAFAFNNTNRICCVHVPSSVKVIGEFAFGANEFNHVRRVKYQGIEVNWNLIEFSKSGLDMTDSVTTITKKFNVPLTAHANTKTETTTEGSTVCTKVNVTTYTCACGCSWRFSTTPKGHVPADEYTVIYVATCTSTGTRKLYCTVCGNSVISQTIPALGHDYELIEHIKPTCEESGEKTYKCTRTRCNQKRTEVAESPLGHTNSGETVKIDPTCTEDGGLYYLCGRCNEPILDEYIEIYPATGHTPGEWKCTQEPTCSQPQVDTLFCSVCTQGIETRTGDYGDHFYDDEFYYEECTYRYYEVGCIYCDDYYYEYIEAPDDAIFGEDESGLGHIVEEVITEPTCTKPGQKYNRCVVCDQTIGEVTELSEALGHKWEEVNYWEPTCYEEGYIYYRCSLCKRGKYEDLPMVPHTFEKWEYVDGNIFSGECTYCGDVFENIEVKLTLDKTELTLYNQATQTLTVTVTEHITDDIVFTSSDSSIASVDANGTITANAPGNAVITATINGTEITAQCKVRVNPRRFHVDWIVDGKLYYRSLVREGSEIEILEAPEKAGYMFAGWTPEVPEIMPSSNLTFTAVYYIVSQSDDYDVSATYLTGSFNEDVTLEVAKIQGEREPGGVYMVEGEYYKQVGLYNIKMVNRNSEVVQPNDGYKVTIRIAIPEAYKNNKTFMVYHRFTGGGREQLSTENGTLKVENGYLVFDVTKFSEFEIFVPSPYIKITQLPDKTVYYYNTAKELDLSGIRIRYTKADGTTKTLTDSSALTVTGFDGSKVGKQTITVKYGQYSDTFEITVKYNWWQWIIHVLFLGFLKR